MQPKNLTRIPFLDGIRGYAALWVMVGHLCNLTRFHFPTLDNPGIAVDLFMMISGFLMTQHFFVRQASEPWESPRSWFIFYLRRFFRIAPLYYLVLIPCFLWFDYFRDTQQTFLAGAVAAAGDNPTVTILNAANIWTHISFLFGVLPQYCCFALAIPDWSIGLEMQFYAAFPFLMLLARRWNIFRFGLLVIPVWGYFRKSGILGFPLPSFLPMKLGLFAIGMLLAWAWMQDKGKLTARASVLLLLAVALSGMAGSGAIVVTATILMALMLFYEEESMGLGLGPWIRAISRFLGNRVSHFLADVSYGVYLLHLLVLIPVLSRLNAIPWYAHCPSALRFLILGMIVAPVTFSLAWILFRCIETPGIRLGKVLVNKLYGPSLRPNDAPLHVS